MRPVESYVFESSFPCRSPYLVGEIIFPSPKLTANTKTTATVPHIFVPPPLLLKVLFPSRLVFHYTTL